MKQIALLYTAISIALAGCSVTKPKSDYLMNNLNKEVAWNEIDTGIIRERGLQTYFETFRDCDWENRKGKFVDVFWLQNPETGQNRFGYIYEYLMDCDSLRFIYWYPDARQSGELVDLMIEPLEEESIFIVKKKKSLNYNPITSEK